MTCRGVVLCVAYSEWIVSLATIFLFPIVSSIMSEWRFELLLSNLHLNDDEKMPPQGSPHFGRLSQ